MRGISEGNEQFFHKSTTCCLYKESKMKVYTGSVKALKRGYGFIDKYSVRKLDDNSDYYHEKDIYFHQSDFTETISVNRRIRFTVEKDPVRENAFRAYPLRELSIELHVDDAVIDHPVIHVRWCIDPAVVEEMKAHLNYTWYIAIVGQLCRSDAGLSRKELEKTALHPVVGLEEIGDARSYMELHAPGAYDLVAYLVRSPVSKERVKKKLARFERFDLLEVWENWEEKKIAQDAGDLRFLQTSDSGNDVVMSYSHMTISLPAEIFAKPLPKPVLKLLSYYDITTDRKNECDVNKLVILTCLLGFPWFLVWEFLKRGTSIGVGILHLCFGGNPMNAWRFAFAKEMSAPGVSGSWGKDQYEPLTSWDGWRVLYHPLLLLVLLAFLGATYAFPDIRVGIAQTLGTIIGVVGAVCLFGIFSDSAYFENFLMRTIKEVEHYKQDKEVRTQSELITRLSTYAVCNRDATPPQARTARLVWSGIKRKVCRTYG